MSFNIPQTTKKRVVIVGGGFGGLKLAYGLRKSNFQVILIDKNNYHQFPPLIYQIATAGLNPSSISFPYRKIFEDREDYFYRMAELRSIHSDEKCIQTSIGKINYDYLVLANGTSTNFFGNTHIQDAAQPMKTVTEAMGLRNALLLNFERAVTCSSEQEKQELLNVVIVGGGPSGVEIAGALAEMKRWIIPKDYPDMDTSNLHIYIIQGDNRLLPGMSAKASAKSLQFLQKMGIEIKMGTFVTDCVNNEVTMSDGSKILSRNLIWVGGVTGCPINGIDKDCYGRGRRLKVDAFNRVQGVKDIFAIGDAAIMENEDPNYLKGHPQMAQPAIQQGDLLAKNLQAKENGQEMKPFRYKDLGSMATIGKNKAVADLGKFHFGGFFAWVLWMGVHLVSILGVRNKLSVFMDWMWNYFTYDRSNRMILKSFESKNMKDLEQKIQENHWGDLHPNNDEKPETKTTSTPN